MGMSAKYTTISVCSDLGAHAGEVLNGRAFLDMYGKLMNRAQVCIAVAIKIELSRWTPPPNVYFLDCSGNENLLTGPGSGLRITRFQAKSLDYLRYISVDIGTQRSSTLAKAL